MGASALADIMMVMERFLGFRSIREAKFSNAMQHHCYSPTIRLGGFDRGTHPDWDRFGMIMEEIERIDGWLGSFTMVETKKGPCVWIGS